LSEVIPVFVLSDAGVKVIDDLPVLEFPLFFVAPAAVLVEKEHGCFFGNDDFSKMLLHKINVFAFQHDGAKVLLLRLLKNAQIQGARNPEE
jgi:hypothetical protein